MKNTTFLALFLSLLFVMPGNAKELFLNKIYPLEISSQNNNWELVKTENGIKVYVSTYVWDDGALKLKLKFENTGSSDIDVAFEVVSNHSSDVVGTYKVHVKANSSSEFMNEKKPIEIAVGQTEKDFNINFK